MQRVITGYHQDDVGDWVAELACGHGQHVRHRPPFQLRPWVVSEEDRTARLGSALGCVRCDAFEIPADFVAYKRTPEFDERTIPDALRRDHATKPGVWAVIHVLAGQLRYVVEPPLATERLLDAAHPGIVAPEVKHRIAPEGAVRCYVEFHRAPAR
ncbi:MAG: DUF3565 domain-containing protein [Deltaproteobacteria bacterium]|nr:DUF3565 domain-containing protein [Deltaproteobacteria bacterium]